MSDVDHIDIDEAEAGALRWKAIEAFNGAPRLTPLACRLGIALICAMDSKTRRCFPSEDYLAARLNVTIRAIQKAKEELKAAGLIGWTYMHGRRRGGCLYQFNWAGLERHCEEAKARGKEAVDARKHERPFLFKQANSNGARNCERNVTRNGVTFKPEPSDAKPEQNCSQTRTTVPLNPNPSSSDTTSLSTHLSEQQDHDARARDVTAARASPPQQEKALDEKTAEPRPNIWEALCDHLDLMTKLIDAGQEEEATAILNSEGRDAAMAFVASL